MRRLTGRKTNEPRCLLLSESEPAYARQLRCAMATTRAVRNIGVEAGAGGSASTVVSAAESLLAACMLTMSCSSIRGSIPPLARFHSVSGNTSTTTTSPSIARFIARTPSISSDWLTPFTRTLASLCQSRLTLNVPLYSRPLSSPACTSATPNHGSYSQPCRCCRSRSSRMTAASIGTSAGWEVACACTKSYIDRQCRPAVRAFRRLSLSFVSSTTAGREPLLSTRWFIYHSVA